MSLADLNPLKKNWHSKKNVVGKTGHDLSCIVSSKPDISFFQNRISHRPGTWNGTWHPTCNWTWIRTLASHLTSGFPNQKNITKKKIPYGLWLTASGGYRAKDMLWPRARIRARAGATSRTTQIDPWTITNWPHATRTLDEEANA